jgi:hypothetical protein
MPGPVFFAWIAGPEPFDPLTHAQEDEEIVALTISQDESDFASLQIDVRNTGEGLLGADRSQWCWLSWEPAPAEAGGSAIVPLFTGRLVAVPERVEGEVMGLLFRARPLDYEQAKADLADTLRVLPYYDRVWISGDLEDDDAVLNAYSAQWHIDRTSLEVTISDDLVGEDGTIDIDEDQHTYDDLSLSYADTPKIKAKFTGALDWTQSGAGTIDLTSKISGKFKEQKSIYNAIASAGIISTMTGDGLKNDWPKGGASLGGGWTVSNLTFVEDADEKLFQPYTYKVQYQGIAPGAEDGSSEDLSNYYLTTFTDYEVKFPVYGIKQNTLFDWEAGKARTETLEFTLVPDIQPLEADETDETTITLSISATDTVTEPDDAGDMPIGFVERASYLNTDRGASSVQYALLLARAELRRAARAVEISVRVPWSLGIAASLRKNLHVVDRRLPGGEALGKITSYTMTASADEGMSVELVCGCAIGRGGTVAATAGAGLYADPGYMDTGYQQMAGATIAAPTGDLVYQSLDDFTVTDDGVDLLTLDETTAVQELTLTGGLADQIAAVTDSMDPIETLKDWPSIVCVQLVPVADLSFETTYTPTVELLPIPRGIDLEGVTR